MRKRLEPCLLSTLGCLPGFIQIMHVRSKTWFWNCGVSWCKVKQLYYLCYLFYYHTLTLSLVAVFGSGKFRCLKWWILVSVLEIIPRHVLDRHIYLVLLKSCFSLVQMIKSLTWIAAISSLHLEACILVRASFFDILASFCFYIWKKCEKNLCSHYFQGCWSPVGR